MPKYVILTEGRLGPLTSKTGNAILRYQPDEAVAILDSTHAGKTAQDVLGYGGGVPVVSTLDEAIKLGPDTLLIGIAPTGGRLPDAWQSLLMRALRADLDIVSGLHTMLCGNPSLSRLAFERGRRITDLRACPPELEVVSKGTYRERVVPTVLTVGADCNIGKMTALLNLEHSLARRGVRATFVGTGQTGILLSGRGVAVDAVISDYTAGAIESEIDRAIRETAPEIVLVEGQGALTHPGYSGVTLGLLHGTMPDAMILVHQPSRKTNDYGLPIPPLGELIGLHEQAVGFFKPAKVVAIALNGLHLSDDECRAEAARIEAETGLPTVETVRFGADRLADAVAPLLVR